MTEQATIDACVEQAPAPASPIAEYNATAAGLAALRHKYAGAVFDVTVAEGMKAARAARRELVSLRTGIEAKRVELKAPILERGRLLDSEARRITAELLALEQPIDAQIEAEESRKAAEKAARDKAEADRLAAINVRIAWIGERPLSAVGKTAAEVRAIADALDGLPMTADLYGEHLATAESTRVATLARLLEIEHAVEAQEREAARIADEQRKLAEQRAQVEREESERRARIEAEDRERRERIAREDAERAEQRRRDDEAAEAERQRVARIRTAIECLRNAANVRPGTPAAMIAAIRASEAAPLSREFFAEFADEAAQVQAATLAALAIAEDAAREREQREAQERADREAAEAKRRQEREALEHAADPWRAIEHCARSIVPDESETHEARLRAVGIVCEAALAARAKLDEARA
jgi:colicin import membrane protein